MSDPGQYRSREEVEEWRKRDPIPLARRRLAEEADVGDETFREIDAQVKAEIEDAVRFAEDSPPADDYASYTYADGPPAPGDGRGSPED